MKKFPNRLMIVIVVLILAIGGGRLWAYQKAVVEVTMEDGKMVNIDLIEHEHGPGFEAPEVTDWIIEKQSINVDSVSGATLSSTVIKKATEQALLQGMK